MQLSKHRILQEVAKGDYAVMSFLSLSLCLPWRLSLIKHLSVKSSSDKCLTVPIQWSLHLKQVYGLNLMHNIDICII